MWFKVKSLEDKEYLKFYLIQWVMFLTSIAKGTAIGFISYKLKLSAIELAVFAAVSTLGALGTYLISSVLRNKSRNIEMFFISTQVLNLSFTLIALFYSFYCYWVDSWGNFYFWLIINFLLCLSIYLEPTARSIYVKRRFPNFNFADITRSDVMTMGFAKIMGFGAGFFITSSIFVVYVYLISTVSLILFLSYLFKRVKIRPFRKLIEDKVSSIEVMELNYTTTVLILIFNASFLTSINTQSVTYSLFWAVPFYLFSVVGSVGNILFSTFVNKNVDLTLKKGFKKYIVLIIVGFSILYFLNGYWTLLGFLILGGVGSTLHLFSNARLYSSVQGQSTKIVSLYYLKYNIAFAAFSLLFGLMIEKIGLKNVFLIYMFLPAVILFWITLRDKKLIK